jgi:hypothetical protein
VDATQAQVQAHLGYIHQMQGLAAALRELFNWCVASGYLPQDIFTADEMLAAAHVGDEADLQLQLNRSRQRYQLASPGGGVDKDCQLCRSNTARPGKELLRIYDFTLNHRPFFLQHTPFPFHRGHFVLIEAEHTPMRVDQTSLEDLADFLRQAPEFTVCSNSDIAWAGASILGHHHYQAFDGLRLPVMEAPTAGGMKAGHGPTRFAMLNYPAAVLRIEGPPECVIEAGAVLLRAWKATAPGQATANLIMHQFRAELVLHVIFRHAEHRTTRALQIYKREGVGVLEMGGMVIIPAPGEPEDCNQIRAHVRMIARGIIADNSPCISRMAQQALFHNVCAWLT